MCLCKPRCVVPTFTTSHNHTLCTDHYCVGVYTNTPWFTPHTFNGYCIHMCMCVLNMSERERLYVCMYTYYVPESEASCVLSSRSIDSFLLGVTRLREGEGERGSERCGVTVRWFRPFIRRRCVCQHTHTAHTHTQKRVVVPAEEKGGGGGGATEVGGGRL